METYLVGGAVRDQLLGLSIHERDWVVTNATPEQMLTQGYTPVGKDFPVFLHPETHEEYALARTERKTAPGYHGFIFHADPSVTLEQDLYRRDLTINAIAQDSNGKLFDPYGGQKDLQQKILRHVSPAFTEDPVRILRLARFAARSGLAGLEFLAGIPGTLGGALALNAGAHGGEIWTRVRQVTTIDRGGRLRARGPADFRVGYRQVTGPAGEWFLAAELELEPGEPAVCQARIRDLLERRNRTQPIGEPSCGSVFRNPPGDYAARLIEAAGLKGAREGGAQVSTRHANFIVNTGGASARDILALMARIQARVEGQSGVRLQPEVHCIGGTLP